MKFAGKPTGDGGGGGGCCAVDLVSIKREHLGRGEAMTALDRSWPRQWLVATERRRRFGGSGEDIVGATMASASLECLVSGVVSAAKMIV